jgi:nitrogen fixation/metabolism regulation signal transduction histidine kinase
VSTRRPRWTFESRLLAGALLVAAPALVALLVALLAALPGEARVFWLWSAVVAITCILAFALQRKAVYPLYTLTNLLEALREGDYSLRGTHAYRGDAIGEVLLEINALSQSLREQRLSFEERGALLARVVATLDIAILAFDADGRLQLANPAAQRLLALPAQSIAGHTAQSLDLADCLAVADAVMLERDFPGGSGRREIRHARFRENGRPHDLLVISDLSRALREEERIAWQRLLRVLGHEINNSLAPICSMAGTLATLIGRETLPADWREDVQGGLHVIGDRAEALARFMARYTRLARLPPPNPRDFDFAALIRRAARLEQRLAVDAQGGAASICADPEQVEQALINLIRNATDAALEGGGHVAIRWRASESVLVAEIIDDGPGLPPSENLFVPFFTTKPGGSGIGLVLARQIVEAHGGRLELKNRRDVRGCVARMELPVGEMRAEAEG